MSPFWVASVPCVDSGRSSRWAERVSGRKILPVLSRGGCIPSRGTFRRRSLCRCGPWWCCWYSSWLRISRASGNGCRLWSSGIVPSCWCSWCAKFPGCWCTASCKSLHSTCSPASSDDCPLPGSCRTCIVLHPAAFHHSYLGRVVPEDIPNPRSCFPFG